MFLCLLLSWPEDEFWWLWWFHEFSSGQQIFPGIMGNLFSCVSKHPTWKSLETVSYSFCFCGRRNVFSAGDVSVRQQLNTTLLLCIQCQAPSACHRAQWRRVWKCRCHFHVRVHVSISAAVWGATLKAFRSILRELGAVEQRWWLVSSCCAGIWACCFSLVKSDVKLIDLWLWSHWGWKYRKCQFLCELPLWFCIFTNAQLLFKAAFNYWRLVLWINQKFSRLFPFIYPDSVLATGR